MSSFAITPIAVSLKAFPMLLSASKPISWPLFFNSCSKIPWLLFFATVFAGRVEVIDFQLRFFIRYLVILVLVRILINPHLIRHLSRG